MVRTKAAPLITRRALADAHDVHSQTVTKWEQAGMPVAERGRKGRPSLYAPAQVQAWLDAREEAAQEDGALDLIRERARKEHWQAHVAEQTYRSRERELLPREEVEKAWSAERDAIRTRLLALKMEAARVGRAMTLDGVPGVEVVLEAISREILIELSEAPSPQLDVKKTPARRKAKKKVARRKVAKRKAGSA